MASNPTLKMTEEKKRELLSFVIVGGGPISVEFGGELHDMLRKDMKRLYPDLMEYVKVHLVEAG